MMTKLMAKIAFGSGGDSEGDPDRAAAKLERAGYTVHRLPDGYRLHLQDLDDDHMEAVKGGTIDAIMDEVRSIADEYGGFLVECGPIEPDHVPFYYMLGSGINLQ
jgi:hypothetical protein